jgi:hypothetical protein
MKLEKGERRQITRGLRALASAQALIAGDLPAPLLQKLRLEGNESPEEASDQILIRLLRMEEALKHYLIKASSRKGRAAACNEPRIYLSRHYVTCKSPKCLCRTDPSKRHGPYWMGSVRYGSKERSKTHWYHLGACSKVSREEALQLLQDYAEGRKTPGLEKRRGRTKAAQPRAPEAQQESPEEIARSLAAAVDKVTAAEALNPSPEGPAELPEQLQKPGEAAQAPLAPLAAAQDEEEKPRTKGAAKPAGRITANLPAAIQEKIKAQQEALKGKPLKGLLPSPSSPKVLRIWEPAQACPICLKKLGVKEKSVVSYETIEKPVHYSCLLKLAISLNLDPGICKIVYHLNEADIIKVSEILRRQKK